ncbi:hypothetical protein DSC47_10130 [Elizabethkingia miricola]|uniref:YopX family protein n=1 Tax=Elizabethkingia bruuniana TaxID=1756149 RepID=UPI00099A6F78|nr:YopX family protein [Elizabethkingia bruuniana]OPC66354.1 hypothetical protein BAY13_16585 [Elizabethkingia bruuniana]RBI91648.1 hypothetical protein DSC47_10130 [Elizabethkingia miricola]
MKREIIFRGKRVDNGEWVEGSLVMVSDGESLNRYPCIVVSYNHDTFDWYEVIPETVGQFTGLLDCKGNRIFEGDILKGKYLVYHQDPELLPIEHDISGEVKFIEGFFACENFSFVYPEYEVEIIGNIHESLTPNK